MNKPTDIKNHPASYAVMPWNDDDEMVNTSYFLNKEDADRYFEEAEKTYENVNLYQILRCSEKKDDS